MCIHTEVPLSLIWQPAFQNLTLSLSVGKVTHQWSWLNYNHICVIFPGEKRAHFIVLAKAAGSVIFTSELTNLSEVCIVCQPLRLKAPCTPSERHEFKEMLKFYSSVPVNCTEPGQFTLASSTWIPIIVLLSHYFQRGCLKTFYCKYRKAIEQSRTLKHNKLDIVLDKCQCTGRGEISLPMLQAGKQCACVEKQMAAVFY